MNALMLLFALALGAQEPVAPAKPVDLDTQIEANLEELNKLSETSARIFELHFENIDLKVKLAKATETVPTFLESDLADLKAEKEKLTAHLAEELQGFKDNYEGSGFETEQEFLDETGRLLGEDPPELPSAGDESDEDPIMIDSQVLFIEEYIERVRRHDNEYADELDEKLNALRNAKEDPFRLNAHAIFILYVCARDGAENLENRNRIRNTTIWGMVILAGIFAYFQLRIPQSSVR